jgi:hypothetical protein
MPPLSPALDELTSIISELGGPSVPPADLSWALDIPAGRSLIEWLVAQLGEPGDERSPILTSLEMIALQQEEVHMYVFLFEYRSCGWNLPA